MVSLRQNEDPSNVQRPTEASLLLPSSTDHMSGLYQDGAAQNGDCSIFAVARHHDEEDAVNDKIVFLRHDSEASVGTSYVDGSSNDLLVFQGALLLTAECMGTGVLALPGNVHVLGWWFGLGFLVLNAPINLYAGTILSHTARFVEEKQATANRLYRDLLASVGSNTTSMQQNNGAVETRVSVASAGTLHSQLHHDTATHDFVGMATALFSAPSAHDAATSQHKGKVFCQFVKLTYYINIFLVLGNYLLVMSHAVQAMCGGPAYICLPTCGVLAGIGMFVVSQSRTMARLARTASIPSLLTLLIVIVQCLMALWEKKSTRETLPTVVSHNDNQLESMLRKLSATGSIGFALGSQKLFLNIRHELANRRDAPTVLAYALTATVTVYVTVVVLAGANPPSFLFDAIPAGTASRRIAGFLLWAHVSVSYAINSQALCGSLDRLAIQKWLSGKQPAPGLPQPALKASPSASSLDSEKETDETLNQSGCRRPWSDRQRWLLITIVVSTLSYSVANAVPFFSDLVALIGAMTSVPLTLLLPALFWRKHLNLPLWLPTPDSWTSYALVVFSVVFMITATLGAIHSIRQDWARHGPPFSCQ
jgi:amino acid permease